MKLVVRCSEFLRRYAIIRRNGHEKELSALSRSERNTSVATDLTKRRSFVFHSVSPLHNHHTDMDALGNNFNDNFRKFKATVDYDAKAEHAYSRS